MRTSIAALPLLCLVVAVAGFLTTALLPAAQSAGRGRARSEAERAGFAIYVREGCATCHTQQVRTVEARFGVVSRPGDVGEASRPSDYADQNPAVAGFVRIGPDLAHVGGRIVRAEDMARAVREPQRRMTGSRMPPHAYLSDEELGALVAYLLSLK